ncbi:MAG: YdeI/OmpD-associated family protein [Actinobacteria bacterium]|nr:YdeI/OmpD-associated family protein [Actinomycetota bacterium]
MTDLSKQPQKDPGPIKFAAKLCAGDRGGAYVEFPFDVNELFGTKGRVPVHMTVNGTPYRGSLMKYRGVRMIGVTKAVREAGGTAIGDQVEIVLKLDTEERVVEMPADLAEALSLDSQAMAGWERFAYTHQLECVTAILGAKREETRAKRVAGVVEAARKRAEAAQTRAEANPQQK